MRAATTTSHAAASQRFAGVSAWSLVLVAISSTQGAFTSRHCLGERCRKVVAEPIRQCRHYLRGVIFARRQDEGLGQHVQGDCRLANELVQTLMRY
jgi:hypothetical protein